MSKRAKEAALKAYPDFDEITPIRRSCYEEGYEQAKKDYIELAQLWVDNGNVNIMSFKQFLKCHETQSNK